MAKPLEQTWSELQAYVEQIFFTQLGDKIAGFADDLAQQIETQINHELNGFFKGLAGMIQPGLEGIPGELELYTNVLWPELSYRYYKWKNPASKRSSASDDLFMLSELPRILRNSRKSRSLRRKTVASRAELRTNPSLRMALAKLGSPTDYYGDVSVTITLLSKRAKGGNKAYRAGTFRLGVDVRDQVFDPKNDYVRLTVNWLPAISGLDPDVRGVTEKPSPRNGLPVKQLPDDVQKKLMNSAYTTEGQPAYRPLLGPYMLWYQDTVIKRIIKDAIAPYGPIL